MPDETMADARRALDRCRRCAAGCALVLFGPELRAWQGRLPLGRVFWVQGVLTSLAIAVLYAMAAEARRWGLQQGLLLVFAGHTAWILVAVWRCAEGAAPGWRTIARGLTVAWALNAALVSAFLELGLIAARLGM